MKTLAMLAVLFVVAACSKDATGGGGDKQAGTLTVRLTTPHADDGAMTFQVSGGPIDSVLAGDASLRLFTRRVSESEVAGAVVGVVANGAVVTLRVPDVGAATGYTARVIEVADRQNALRGSLTGYVLMVTP